MGTFNKNRPLRVGVLFSGGASGARYLDEHDPDFGDTYELVCGVTSTPDASGISFFEEKAIPVEQNDIKSFYSERDAATSDLDLRAEYDAMTREMLTEYHPDILLLSGYMWILTKEVIDAYPTINVHPADLTITDDNNSRVYIGHNPVKDAILNGESETRSSVHFVTSGVDEGPILARSKPFTVHQDLVNALTHYDATEAVEKYCDSHQEWMKWEGDGPAIACSLNLIATGRVAWTDTAVTIDGTTGFFDLEAEMIRCLDEGSRSR